MLDRVSQFALGECAAALADAQLALDDEDPDEIGVAIGTGMGGHRVPTRDTSGCTNDIPIGYCLSPCCWR
jgi:3-oxoacyl-(acyl-carrier-protein) synthase